MSETSTDRADRPAEVTDPLLWGLSAAVADAHQPDEDQICVSPSCVGAAWPCAAWNNAQEGLRAAQGGRTAPSAGSATPEPAGTTAESGRDDPLTGWSTALVPADRAERLAVTAA
ncbi:hypothetical protein [Micromonospora terminaliae]|uniref:hypothetical protein n=1 Tax=Micromonospora terminaliae TaxID=1914461 RepID=UPI001EF7F623|nr:hypothetical protein [Micromonospora terminaliae]